MKCKSLVIERPQKTVAKQITSTVQEGTSECLEYLTGVTIGTE
jgi:hypothetical protein